MLAKTLLNRRFTTVAQRMRSNPHNACRSRRTGPMFAVLKEKVDAALWQVGLLAQSAERESAADAALQLRNNFVKALKATDAIH